MYYRSIRGLIDNFKSDNFAYINEKLQDSLNEIMKKEKLFLLFLLTIIVTLLNK